jgi:hypothetical protein
LTPHSQSSSSDRSPSLAPSSVRLHSGRDHPRCSGDPHTGWIAVLDDRCVLEAARNGRSGLASSGTRALPRLRSRSLTSTTSRCSKRSPKAPSMPRSSV